MKINDWISIASAVFGLKLFRKRTPIVVSWSLTDRCNSKCKYCSRWKRKSTELNTKQIFSIIDELTEMGTRRVIFTGGEPLIREDIGEIVDYTAKKSIYTIIDSNGDLVPRRIYAVSKLKRFVFSFDGPKEIHDWLRGEGSYNRTLEAIKIAKDYGIEVELVTVLSKINLDSIDYILYTAESFDTKVSFQPISEHILDKENSGLVVPSGVSYRKAIERIILKKKEGNNSIRNSSVGLSHLYNWPNSKAIECAGGLLSCRIDTNGDVNYCDRPQTKKNILNCIRDGFKNAFNNLSPFICNSCWCGMRGELNYLLKLNLNCIYNLMKIEMRY